MIKACFVFVFLTKTRLSTQVRKVQEIKAIISRSSKVSDLKKSPKIVLLKGHGTDVISYG